MDFQYTHEHAGPFDRARAFGDIIVKTGERRPHHAARATSPGSNLGAKNQDVNNYMDGTPSVGIGVFQLPGSNALDRPTACKAKMDELKSDFPRASTTASTTIPRLTSASRSDKCSIRCCDAVLLVAMVVLVFLQNWRSALIPLIAVPVAIIGTFAAMAVMGFSLNTLSLFGLVLAIGIVVDDAIVVVEATEHHIEAGMMPRAARTRPWTRSRRRSWPSAWCSRACFCRACSSRASRACSSASSP